MVSGIAKRTSVVTARTVLSFGVAGVIALPMSAAGPALAATPTAAVAAAPGVAQAVPAAVQTPGPVDRFENRRSIGREGLVLVESRGQLDQQLGRIPKIDVRRANLQTDWVDGETKVVNPPVVQSSSVAATLSKSSQSQYRSKAVEADLDLIKYPDDVWRPSLEPGLAHAGTGIGCSGQSAICVTWSRPAYDANHQLNGFAQTFHVALPGGQPSDLTEVALAPGRFGTDAARSLVVSYVQAGTNELRVARIGVQRDANGRVTGLSVAGPVLSYGPVYSNNGGVATSPSLAVADFTGAGSDQVAVLWAPQSSTAADRHYRAALLKVDGQGDLQEAVPPQTITPSLSGLPGSGDEQAGPGAAVVRDTSGNGPEKPRLFVGSGIQGNGRLTELVPSGASFTLKEKLMGTMDGATLDTSQWRNFHSQIESVGDLTGDGVDELVSMPEWGILNQPNGFIDVVDVGTYENVFRTLDSQFTIPFAEMTVLDTRPTNEQVVAPVPGQASVRAFPQIAVAARTDSGCSSGERAFFNFASLNSQGKMTFGSPQFISDCGAPDTPELASMALDGRAELGDPVPGRYTTLEPSVILNAPPTHFDVLDGRMYDPNFCYAGNQYLVPPVCFFTSEYEKKTEATTEVTSESTEDWAVSAKASAEFSLFDVVDVEAEIRGGYGEKFKNVDATTTKDTIEVNVKARNTDKIYAIRRAYDTLEYPIYQPGGTQPSAYVLTTTPHTITKRWIDINSPDAVDLNVNHQPGNILSYPEDLTEQENPFISPTAKDAQSPPVGPFAEQEFELSDFSDFTYTLTKEKVTAEEASTEKDWNVGGTLKGGGNVAGLVKVSVEVSGDYKNSSLTNTKTSVGDTTKLAAILGGIDESFGETAYTVKPFAYWNESAALVLDYAVSPGIAPPGSPRTWWQQMYGKKPDVTLKLPRLLDYEKQAGISSDSARFISPGVQVFRGPCAPNDPRVPTTEYAAPGVPLCLRAQVENYSLKDQPAGVSVEFFDADPDVGGVSIGKISNLGAIPARGSQFAYLDWTPDARYAGSAPRFFAKVDSDGVADEVHEDNNKGYRSHRIVAVTSVAPRAPEDVEVDLSPGRTLDIQWSDPLGPVQPTGHDWRVVAYPEDGSSPLEKLVPGGQTATSFPDVAPGRYRVAVFSISGGTESPASHPSEPIDVVTEAPSAPSNVTGTPGDQSIGLQWDPPSATGGAPIDSYRIREFRQPGETFPETPIDTTVTGTTTAMTLSGLTNGRPYRFTVQAINGAAPGDQSSPSAPVTPLGVPEKVTDVKAKRGGPGEAEITWKPPTPSSARAGVTSYEIAVSPGGTLFQFPGDAVTATVPGLQTGVTYTFTVRPISATGRGPESDQSNPLTLPDAPSAPRNVRAAAGSAPGSAVVSWIPPASNGGVPMDSYRVCLMGGACQEESGTTQQSTFTGLTVGTPLIFTVTGRNEAGLESPPATTPEVSLAAAPDIAIVRGPAEGSYTTPDATIEFATSIDGAGVTCFIDGVGQACASPLRLTGLSDGKHTFRAKAEGPGGAAQTPLLSWMVDSQDPKVAIDDLPAIARKGIPRLRYSGADRGGSGLASYQIRTRQSGVLGNFEEPVIVNDADSSPERVRRLTIGRGKTVCASVRTVDGVGHWSGWSDWSCVSRPLDQASLKASGRWAPVKGRFFSAEEGTQGRGLPFCVVDPDRAHGSRVRDRGGVQRLRTTGSPAQGSTAQGHRPLAGRRRPTGHGRW